MTQPAFELISTKPEDTDGFIRFYVPEYRPDPIIEFCPNGDIFVKGRLVENDKEVMEALREFLKMGKVRKVNE
jgi:hypothetical protein